MEMKLLLLGLMTLFIISAGYAMPWDDYCPYINNASLSDDNISLGRGVTISANVTPVLLNKSFFGFGGIFTTRVWADVSTSTGHTIVNLSLNDSSNDLLPYGEFDGVYYPYIEGIHHVTIYAALEKRVCKYVFLEGMKCDNKFICNSSKFVGDINVNPPTSPPSPEACRNITSPGLALVPGDLDKDKVGNLFGLSYYCTKNLLGLWDYNMIIEFTYLNGSYVKEGSINLVYGLAPGQPSNNVVYGIPGSNVVSPRFAAGSSSGGGIRANNVQGDYAKVFPVEGNYSKVVYLDRIAVLKTDFGYKLVRVSIGVWK